MSKTPTQTFIDFLKSETIEDIAGAMIELQKTVDRLKTAKQQEPYVHAISGKTADELWLETGRLRCVIADLQIECKELREKNAQPTKQLTDEEIDRMTQGNNYPGTVQGARRFARAIEATHGIKGDA